MEFFERPSGGERAVLVHLNLGDDHDAEDLAEFKLLVESAGVEPAALVTGSRHRPDSRYFAGTGKVEEIRQAVLAAEAAVAIFDHELSPAQERNLERALSCRVVDRTGLILDIFAQRARTFEGKLQVELAQLEHLASRLVRGWTHLERQKGGIGLRGPGETQLETDRRLLKARVASLKERLDKVRQTRAQGRQARQKAAIPTVSIVGYTNAGKSTLFNRLTRADVYAANQLFATLDPTLRRIDLPNFGPVVLADTVGFIRHLPHDLVEAFKATLEETVEADLLLHVVDAASPERERNIAAVEEVLAEVGATAPRFLIYNKLDQLVERQPRLDGDDAGQPVAVWCSALTGLGMTELEAALAQRLTGSVVDDTVELAPNEGRLRARFFALGAVQQEEMTEFGGWRLRVRLPRPEFDQLMRNR